MEIVKLFSIILFISFCIIFKFDRRLDVVRSKDLNIPKRIVKIEPGTIDQVIDEAAARWRVNREILHGIAYIESSKNQNVGAIPEPNKTKSYGLFQINDTFAKDERAKPSELIKDHELNAHLGAKKVGYYCRKRIAKARTVKDQLEIAYGCYRGADRDPKLYSYLKKTGKLKNIKTILG